MREESEDSEPVIVGHHHRALPRERISVIHRDRPRTAREGAAIRPYDHGTPFARRFRAGPDIEIEAVFAGGWRRGTGRAALLLHTHRAELVSFAHAIPMRRWPRLAPAQIAHRRRGVRDALVNAHLFARAGDAR